MNCSRHFSFFQVQCTVWRLFKQTDKVFLELLGPEVHSSSPHCSIYRWGQWTSWLWSAPRSMGWPTTHTLNSNRVGPTPASHTDRPLHTDIQWGCRGGVRWPWAGSSTLSSRYVYLCILSYNSHPLWDQTNKCLNGQFTPKCKVHIFPLCLVSSLMLETIIFLPNFLHETARNKVCGLSWATRSFLERVIVVDFSNVFWGARWAPQAECHIVPLLSREGRHLCGRYLWTSATHTRTI